MGVVYLGLHSLLGRHAAIKVLLPVHSARPDIVNRFFNEARAVTSISDPGIVQVFDFGYHTDGSAFIVMEFLEGETLDRRLERRGRFSVHEAVRLGRQMAISLAAAHAQQIIHRDLKPENIFLVRDAEAASGERSKIVDFGIAKLSDDHPGKIKTHTGTLVGTPMYMSPEQCRGLPEIDQRSDIYALGCVLFHLITGRPPFDGEGMGDIISAHIREPAPPPSSLVVEISPEVDALLLRCLAKAPAARYQTMNELAAALGQLLQQVSPQAASQHAPGHGGSDAASAPPYGGPSPAMGPRPAPKPTPSEIAASTTPTTLGTGSGQIGRSSRRSPRTGRWIAGALVVGAAAGIAGLATRNDGAMGGSGSERSAVATVATATGPGGPSNAMDSPAGAGSVVDAARAPSTGSPVTSAPPAAAEPAHPAAPESAQSAAPHPSEATGSERADAAEVSSAVAPEPGHKRSRDRVHKATTRSPPPTAPATTPEAQRAMSPAATLASPPSALPPSHPAVASQARPAVTPPASKCSKADFAAVYDAAVPPPGAIRAALRSLKACRDAGAITDAEFDRYQTALVARL